MALTRILLLATILFVAAVPSAARCEQPFVPPGKATNAALVYWQAFALLPELNEEELALLTHIEKGEKKVADAGPLLGRSNLSFSLAASVSPDMECRWELLEAGPATLLPHMGKARLLARLLVLEARAQAEAGELEKSLSHLTTALLVARNTDEGVLVQMLVALAIENTVLDAVDQILPRLDADHRKKLQASLSKLPPRASFSQTVQYERELFGNWLRPIMTGEGDDILAAAKTLGPAESAEHKAIVEGTVEERRRRFEDFIAEYDRIIAAAELPSPQAAEEIKQIEKQIQSSANSLIRLLMPSVEKAFKKHFEMEKRWQELEEVLEK